jgi:hypothetical protein
MSTTDGISTEDWDVVHGLAVDVVNASDSDEDPTRQLLDYLEVLEVKYGPLPSILATRADYLEDDDPARETLLLRAHALAEARGDTANVVLAAQSLAELHLSKKNLAEADRWLRRMREHIPARGNDDYSKYERLRAVYRGLAIKSDASIE